MFLPCGCGVAKGSPPKSPSRSTDGGFGGAGCGVGCAAGCAVPGGGATDTGVGEAPVWLPVRGLSLVACAWVKSNKSQSYYGYVLKFPFWFTRKYVTVSHENYWLDLASLRVNNIDNNIFNSFKNQISF